jgi:hypothetical protein
MAEQVADDLLRHRRAQQLDRPGMAEDVGSAFPRRLDPRRPQPTADFTVEVPQGAIGRTRADEDLSPVCLWPTAAQKSPERKPEQRKRWFRNGQKWRTGCEGRISVIKRRHGLNRCRYKGELGIARWVGLGVIADTLINIGGAMAKRSSA